MEEAEQFDKELAAHLRAQARADQGLPPEETQVPSIMELESNIMLTMVQATMEQAAFLLKAGQAQQAAITMQMAICATNMALVKAIQEFSTMYIAFKTGTIRVVQLNENGEEIPPDDDLNE